MRKPKRNPRRQVEHVLFLLAVANGERPLRAVTFVDRKKKANREACRRRFGKDES